MVASSSRLHTSHFQWRLRGGRFSVGMTEVVLLGGTVAGWRVSAIDSASVCVLSYPFLWDSRNSRAPLRLPLAKITPQGLSVRRAAPRPRFGCAARRKRHPARNAFLLDDR